MSPRKRVISIFLILVLLVTAPFSIVKADESDDLLYLDAVYFFRSMYNVMEEVTDSHYSLHCQTASSNGNYCYLYDVDSSGNVTNPAEQFHIFSVPSGMSWSTYTAYNTSKRIRVSTDPLYIVFLSSTNFTTSNVTLYTQSGYSTSFTRVTGTTQTVMTPSGYYLIVLKLWATSQHSQGYNFVTVNMPGSTSTKIIPISYGVESTMSDNVHRLVFGTGQTVEVHDSSVTSALLNLNRTTTDIFTKITNINSDTSNIYTKTNSIDSKLTTANNYLNTIANGNTASTSSVNTVDTANQSLSQDFSQLSTIESGYNTDFNNQIQAINFNDQLSGQHGFLTSSSFVINVFNNLILNNPLTILIIIVSIFYVFRRFV